VNSKICYAGRCQWLPESPRFDITRGMPDRAMATLQRVARENGKPMPLGKLVDVVAEVSSSPYACLNYYISYRFLFMFVILVV